MSQAVSRLLGDWLQRQLPESQFRWLRGELAKLDQGRQRDLDIAFGLAPRKLGRADLALSAADLADADEARPGWDPRGWSVDEAARILALLEFGGGAEGFAKTFMQLCRTAEVGEAVALYRGLPLYPEPEKFEWQAGEGLRTSMRAVFEAIAHQSPFPKENFSQERWNHMVLKALFIGSALHPIQGLDERRNPELALILRDYAHERWAAGRPVTPELWRCLGPFAEGIMIDDLERVAGSQDPSERRAAALALSVSPDIRAPEILKSLPAEVALLRAGALSWENVLA
ncbi:MAG: EboA domain-containing protein [Rhizobiales bacterium]|nr:EboA domain-containing protein [Hyphomicrobiales bacterium]MDQ3557608.1 EboA domain-containing protein [Pseudomonadota bacterium]